ncbi:DegT/DnrJ/EryC1/StrS family aminotransferase [bacterium]|nr:DegT/DnrJ/EryC1/StrS family aminotransferase [bacterium]
MATPWLVPLTDTTLDEAEFDAVAEVLRSGWLTMGREVAAFEREFADAMGMKHGIAVSNGTAALHLAYEAAGLGPEDEFCVPALTFVATMNAGLYLGAKPVLIDCTSEDDLTTSVADLESKITPRTRLIATIPYGGFPPDMEAIEALVRDRNIPLVEDACHAPLALLGDRHIGSFGLASTWSFYGNKNMTTGEGGMVLTDDEATADRIRLLRSHGMSTGTWQRHHGDASRYDVEAMGYNYRLDEVRAAMGRQQLRKLPEYTQRRTHAAAMLRDRLQPLTERGLQIPFATPRGTPVHHLFVVLLPPGTDRWKFRESLKSQGIQTSFHYPALHSFTHTRRMFEGLELPVLDSLIDRLVTLPMGPHLDEEKIDLIGKAVEGAL